MFLPLAHTSSDDGPNGIYAGIAFFLCLAFYVLWAARSAGYLRGPKPLTRAQRAVLSKYGLYYQRLRPAQQKPYITSLWSLMHLLAVACQQLNSQLNFRDADATWPWLDEKVLSANDIENVVARELSDLPLPDEQNWDRLLKRN